MNMKIVGGALGLIVTFFILLLGLTLIMPQAHTIISDANIADYTGLDTIIGASVTVLALAVMGVSIWSIFSGVKQRGGSGGRKRA